jgi:uncharacterized glyoxalase superfamily protein PhnB
MWLQATPQLSVSDVRATQEYYRDVLGFTISWLWQNDYGAVSNGEAQLYLTKDESPIPSTCCCADVEDVDAVYEEYKSKGAKIVSDLETKPWGMREFTIVDPNGHLFRVGQGVKPIREIAEFTTDP